MHGHFTDPPGDEARQPVAGFGLNAHASGRTQGNGVDFAGLPGPTNPKPTTTLAVHVPALPPAFVPPTRYQLDNVVTPDHLAFVNGNVYLKFADVPASTMHNALSVLAWATDSERISFSQVYDGNDCVRARIRGEMPSYHVSDVGGRHACKACVVERRVCLVQRGPGFLARSVYGLPGAPTFVVVGPLPRIYSNML